MATKIRYDDEVVVIAGRDKGKRGKVLRVLKDGRLLVGGVHVIKKHQKPMSAMQVVGAIVTKEAAIQASNVAIFNTETGKADRIGFRFEENKKVRFLKSTGKAL